MNYKEINNNTSKVKVKEEVNLYDIMVKNLNKIKTLTNKVNELKDEIETFDDEKTIENMITHIKYLKEENKKIEIEINKKGEIK